LKKTIWFWAFLLMVPLALLLVGFSTQRPKPPSRQAPTPIAWVGPITTVRVNEFRIYGQRIRLCGVRPRISDASASILEEAVRSRYDGTRARCMPVGGGTPCDDGNYRSPRDHLIAQCILEDDTDLAEILVRSGILCGTREQTIATYSMCSP
jgi:hypothetical protein